MSQKNLPYFDYLLAELDKNNRVIEQSFGRHVHWGYWEHPRSAVCDEADYARAAEQLTLELCDLADLANGHSVLDVGCGFGGTIASLNERFEACRLTGLNIDLRQLARARRLVLPLRGNEVAFCQADACSLPFADASFDRLLAVECIFHFPSREAFFREACRVLKPGGILVLSDFLPTPLAMPLCRLATSKPLEKYNAFGACRFDYTLAKYRALAAATGLVADAERDITRHTLPTYRYIQRLMSHPGHFGLMDLVSAVLIQTQKLWSALGQVKYTLLSFTKA